MRNLFVLHKNYLNYQKPFPFRSLLANWGIICEKYEHSSMPDVHTDVLTAKTDCRVCDR